MDPFKRTSRLFAMSVVALVLVGCANSEGAAPGSTAATVDGIQISEADLAHDQALFRFLSGVNQEPCGTPDPGDPANGVPAETAESACARLTLENLVELVLTDRYAADNQITVSDADVQKALGGLDQGSSAEEIDKALAAEGLTRDDLSALARRFLTLREVTNAIGIDSLGEGGPRGQYDKDIADYTTVTVDHILVETEAEANDVYAQATAPGFTRDDFLALAKQISIDPRAVDNGGAYPAATASTYVPEFAQAAMDLEPGGYSRPVQTDFGWHVIHLVDKQVTPFSQVHDQIVQTAVSIAFPAWVHDLLNTGGIELDPRYGRFDIDQLQVVPIRSTDPSATDPPTPANGVTPTP